MKKLTSLLPQYRFSQSFSKKNEFFLSYNLSNPEVFHTVGHYDHYFKLYNQHVKEEYPKNHFTAINLADYKQVPAHVKKFDIIQKKEFLEAVFKEKTGSKISQFPETFEVNLPPMSHQILEERVQNNPLSQQATEFLYNLYNQERQVSFLNQVIVAQYVLNIIRTASILSKIQMRVITGSLKTNKIQVQSQVSKQIADQFSEIMNGQEFIEFQGKTDILIEKWGKRYHEIPVQYANFKENHFDAHSQAKLALQLHGIGQQTQNKKEMQYGILTDFENYQFMKFDPSGKEKIVNTKPLTILNDKKELDKQKITDVLVYMVKLFSSI